MKAKKPAKKAGLVRPFNGGEWTSARMNSFIKSALRGAGWPQKFVCIKEAFVEHAVNPATGRKCKFYRCATCSGLFPQKEMQADHVTPCIGPEGFVSWDQFISNLYCEAAGFEAVCKPCHQTKTNEERAARAAVV